MSQAWSRTDRRLAERARALVPDGEAVLAALVMFAGPRPGSELAWGGLGGLVGVVALRHRRRYFTLAATDRGLYVFRNSSSHRPSEIVERWDDLRAITEISDATGDPSITIAGTRYWVAGEWAFQVFQLKRLKEQA